MKKYTVDFYELINYGGNWESNGTTTVSGFDEEFNTDSKEDALKEFEERKAIITKDNKLGVTLGTWVDDAEIEQVNYTSEDRKEEENN